MNLDLAKIVDFWSQNEAKMRDSKEILAEVERVLTLYKVKQEEAWQSGCSPWANYNDEIEQMETLRDFVLEERDSLIEE